MGVLYVAVNLITQYQFYICNLLYKFQKSFMRLKIAFEVSHMRTSHCM
jgi:hypothetical protein